MTTENIPTPNITNPAFTTQETIDFGLIIAKVTYTKHLYRLTDDREQELRKIWLDTPLVFKNDSFIYNVLDDGFTIPENIPADQIIEAVKDALNKFTTRIYEMKMEDRKQ